MNLRNALRYIYIYISTEPCESGGGSMIFNPRRGGSEKEYTISVQSGVTTGATKLKPGHVFEAQTPSGFRRNLKMTFKDPDTEKTTIITGDTGHSYFVMPCADVKITY